MSENKGFWKSQVGDYVRVDTMKQTYYGKVESTNFETTVLRPSLIDDRYADSKKGRFYLEKEKPTLIDTRNIMGIQPTSKENLDEICEYYSKKLNQKGERIIIP